MSGITLASARHGFAAEIITLAVFRNSPIDFVTAHVQLSKRVVEVAKTSTPTTIARLLSNTRKISGL